MRRGTTMLLAAALAIGAAASASADPNESYSGIAAEMRARAEYVRQMEAWNGGDMDGALAAYCPTEEIAWVNSRGVTRGYESFARSMRRQFGTSRASMGRLAIDVLDSRSLGENKALVTLRWSITRRGRRQMGGISTQLWEWCAPAYNMRIVFEHAS